VGAKKYLKTTSLSNVFATTEPLFSPLSDRRFILKLWNDFTQQKGNVMMKRRNRIAVVVVEVGVSQTNRLKYPTHLYSTQAQLTPACTSTRRVSNVPAPISKDG
jgi:hypothetical protein